MRKCVSCGTEKTEIEFSTIQGYDACENCVNEHTLPCNDCDEIHWIDDMKEDNNGSLICESCFETHYRDCYTCGEILHVDNIWVDESGDVFCQDCYYESYLRCYDCDCELHRDDVMYDSDGEGFCENCYRAADLDDLPQRPASVISDGFNKNPHKRFVGLEVESIIEGYDYREYPPPIHWCRVSDGSLSSDGHEFVSKPANGDELFTMIDNISDFIWGNGGYINGSCGFHLHVDASDLYWKELKGLLYIMYHLEPFLYRMVAPSRIKSTWCRPLPCSLKEIEGIYSNDDFISLWYDWCGESPSKEKYNNSRYHGLNLHARVYLGTVEFRHHSGTNNPEKIKNWASICLSAVEAGIKLSKGDEKLNRFRGIKPMTLPEIAELLGWESDLIEYVLQRTNLLSGIDTSTHLEYIRS